MKSHALVIAALLASAASAFAADPAAMANLGGEPDCKAGDFFGRYYERPNAAATNLLQKRRHPMEQELIKGVGLPALDAALAKEVADPSKGLGKKLAAADAESKKAKPNFAVIDEATSELRARLRAAANKELQLSKGAPGMTLRVAAARQAVCRMDYLGKRSDLMKTFPDASKADETKTAVAYWTAFQRRELAQYVAETASMTGEVKNYKDLWGGMKARAEDALAKAGNPAEQAALIASTHIDYTVPGAAANRTGEPTREQVQTTAPDVDLTSAQKQGLPDKLLKDYNDARLQVLEANKGKKPEEIAAAMKPILERFRGIVDLRARMPADHRKTFDAKIAATTTPGARDQLVTEYGKSFSPRRQLDVTIDDPNRIFDGNPRNNTLAVTGTSTGTRTTDGRSQAEIAEDLNRQERERQELSRGSHRTSGPGNMIASGIAADKSDEPKPKDPNANRDIINGAKLGLWGVLVGALLMGPLGALFLGALCVGVGTLMSKEANK